MSKQNGQGVHIEDEEGLVDRKTKNHILDLRKQIDNDERELFVEKATDPNVRLDPRQATQYWAVSVKQYLRGIKRLWHEDDETGEGSALDNVEYYWQEKQIGESFTLIPPDKDGYEFSIIAHPDTDADMVRRMLDLPKEESVPQPHAVKIRGLDDILNREKISHTWTVYVDKRGAPPNWERKTLVNEQPLPKELLEDAVEVADNFLQQAGIGFEIAADDYTADDGPGL
jgi:hypothetical protein